MVLGMVIGMSIGTVSPAWAILLGQEFTVFTSGDFEYEPSAVYDSVNQRFLVVWSGWGTGNYDIFGQLLNNNGVFLGGRFSISAAIQNQGSPSAAYDPVNQRFLVTWDDYRSGSNYDIYGQILNGSGTLFGTEITISTAANDRVSPSVAYDPVNQRFLACWTDNRTATNQIYCQLISAAGSLVGGNFTFSTAASFQIYSSVSYDPVNQHFLVVWEDYRNVTGDIYGQILDSNGAQIGGNFSVTADTNAQVSPSVAYDSVTQRFLVVWEDYRNMSGDIYGQILDSNGAPIGSNFSISAAANGQVYPSEAYDPVRQRYLVAWQDYRSGGTSDIYGQVISSNGSLVGSNFSICSAASEQSFPSVAYGSGARNFMVAWQDQRDGDTDIYGMLIGGITTTSLPSGKELTPYAAALQATGGTLPYTWGIVSGSLPSGLSLTSSTGDISGTPSSPGLYPFTVQVTDAIGMTDTALLSITITANQPPTVSVIASPSSGIAPLTVTFTATASDPDGSIAEYRWDFTGDGITDSTTATGDTSYTYTSAGIYEAQVTAVDNLGATASDTVTITVTAPPGGGGDNGCGCTLALTHSPQGLASSGIFTALCLVYVLWMKKRR